MIKAVPTIRGAKITYHAPDLPDLIYAVDSGFKFFAVEDTFRDMARKGVSGLTAWISYSFPRLVDAQWQAVRSKDWQAFDEIGAVVEKLYAIKAQIRPKGYRAGIVDRLMGLASGFLPPEFCRVLRPWRSVDPGDVAWVRGRIIADLGEAYLFDRPEG